MRSNSTNSPMTPPRASPNCANLRPRAKGDAELRDSITKTNAEVAKTNATLREFIARTDAILVKN